MTHEDALKLIRTLDAMENLLLIIALALMAKVVLYSLKPIIFK